MCKRSGTTAGFHGMNADTVAIGRKAGYYLQGASSVAVRARVRGVIRLPSCAFLC